MHAVLMTGGYILQPDKSAAFSPFLNENYRVETCHMAITLEFV